MSGRRLHAVNHDEGRSDERGSVGEVVELGRARSAAGRRWGQFQMVSRRQFAEIMDVSLRTVDNWLASGMRAAATEKWGEAKNSPVRIKLVQAQEWVRVNAE